MSCQHGEDACCQYCLEKVQTTTGDAPPPKKIKRTTTTTTTTTRTTKRAVKAPTTTEKEDSPPEKTMTPRQKRISILVDSSFLAVGAALWYFSTKSFFNMAIDAFDSILDVIGTRTEEE